MIKKLFHAHGLTFLAVVVGLICFAPELWPSRPVAGQPAGDTRGAAERGRLVYLQEGCISCHTQYVRPKTADEAIWGPHRPLDRRQSPPLIGLRRQGPDLSNVGLRLERSELQLQLEQPRVRAAFSTMPSYRQLFADRRGPDLVAYLSTLGNTQGLEETRP
jgi:cbb3-type cytochrome oxidase cytochrome c subunit